jgi:hypothetical protein
MSTATWVLLLIIPSVAGLLILEVIRIRQKGELITHVVRRAVAAQHGPFILFAFIAGFVFGHLFWP